MKNTFFAALSIIFAHSTTFATAETNAQLIQDMLTAVCGEFENSGEGTDFSIDGDASIKLSGLMEKLADAGVEGAASFSSDKYVGVLRSEVGSQLTGVRECRERVWKDLSPLILSSNQISPIDLAGQELPLRACAGLHILYTSDGIFEGNCDGIARSGNCSGIIMFDYVQQKFVDCL